MLEIERLSWLRPRYRVRDSRGPTRIWRRRRFNEAIDGELDGQTYELERDGRKRFVLTSGGSVLATAEAAKRGRWAIAAGGSEYELARRSAWRSPMELRQGETPIGTITKGKAPRGRVVCDLPPELSPADQAFVGVVVLTLWNRAATASSAGATTAATGSH